MLKATFVLIALTVLTAPEGTRAQDLRDADDVLWLLDRDRRSLGVEYQRMLTALDASKVPNADKARDIAIRFTLAHGGLRAEEGPKVVGLLRIGRDRPPFASRGDLVWVVRISHAWLGVTQELWIGSASGEVRPMLSEPAAAHHAYYLFLADAPQGCESCYVPLLIVSQSLEAVAASGRDTTIVLITTYERDSIWKLERSLSLAAADVAARERMVRLRGRRYRYQEIGPMEVLRLLEKPEGNIPIHRAAPAPDKKLLEDLIAVFRGGR